MIRLGSILMQHDKENNSANGLNANVLISRASVFNGRSPLYDAHNGHRPAARLHDSQLE